MVLWSYPPTRNQIFLTAGCFITGAALFAVGVHLSFLNVAPQQDRVKARNEFVKSRLRKYLED
jgi:hypothetical protein